MSAVLSANSAVVSEKPVDVKAIISQFSIFVNYTSAQLKGAATVQLLADFNASLIKLSSDQRKEVLGALPAGKKVDALSLIKDKGQRELWESDLIKLLANRVQPLDEKQLRLVPAQLIKDLNLDLSSLAVDLHVTLRRNLLRELRGGKKTVILALMTNEKNRRVWQADLIELLSNRVRPFLANPSLILQTDPLIAELNLDLATLTDDTNHKFALLLSLQNSELSNFLKLLPDSNPDKPTWTSLITKVTDLSRDGSPTTSASDDSPVSVSPINGMAAAAKVTAAATTSAAAAAAIDRMGLDVKTTAEFERSMMMHPGPLRLPSPPAVARNKQFTLPPSSASFESQMRTLLSGSSGGSSNKKARPLSEILKEQRAELAAYDAHLEKLKKEKEDAQRAWEAHKRDILALKAAASAEKHLQDAARNECSNYRVILAQNNHALQQARAQSMALASVAVTFAYSHYQATSAAPVASHSAEEPVTTAIVYGF